MLNLITKMSSKNSIWDEPKKEPNGHSNGYSNWCINSKDYTSTYEESYSDLSLSEVYSNIDNMMKDKEQMLSGDEYDYSYEGILEESSECFYDSESFKKILLRHL